MIDKKDLLLLLREYKRQTRDGLTIHGLMKWLEGAILEGELRRTAPVKPDEPAGDKVY